MNQLTFTFVNPDDLYEIHFPVGTDDSGNAVFYGLKISQQQLGEFGILCYAMSKMDDEDSIVELISGTLGDDELPVLAQKLRNLADLCDG